MAILIDFTNQIASIVNDCGIREVLKKISMYEPRKWSKDAFLKDPTSAPTLQFPTKNNILNKFKVLYYLKQKAACKLLEPEMRVWVIVMAASLKDCKLMFYLYQRLFRKKREKNVNCQNRKMLKKCLQEKKIIWFVQ